MTAEQKKGLKVKPGLKREIQSWQEDCYFKNRKRKSSKG